MEANIDIGSNLTSLIDRLAHQISTTADKLFSWYVEQAYLQGVTTLISYVLGLVFFGVIFAVAHKKADYNKGNFLAIVSIMSGAAFVLCVGFTLLCGPQQVRKIINPNFYAMQMLTDDISKLVRK